MTISEFIIFIGLVCNIDAPSTQVPRLVKEDCIEYYTNCAVKNGKKVDRLLVSNCNMKAKEASRDWGR
jgi:hypothetical protein